MQKSVSIQGTLDALKQTTIHGNLHVNGNIYSTQIDTIQNTQTIHQRFNSFHMKRIPHYPFSVNSHSTCATVHSLGWIVCTGGYTNRIARFSLSSWNWIGGTSVLSATNLPQRQYHVLESLILSDGTEKLYSFGGEWSGTYYNNLHSINVTNLDTPTESWTLESSQQGNIPSVRSKLRSTVYENRLYMYGGQNNVSPLDSLFKLDPDTLSWTNLGNTPGARFEAVIANMNDYIYIIGGQFSSGATTSVWRYGPLNSGSPTFIPVSALPNQRVRSSVFANPISGNLYLVHGGHGSGSQNTIFRYSEHSQSWDVVTYLVKDNPNAITYTAFANVNGTHFIGLGDQSNDVNSLSWYAITFV